MRKKDSAKCRAHADCFANKTGSCLILTNTDFGKKGCPFYKTREQLEAERKPKEDF